MTGWRLALTVASAGTALVAAWLIFVLVAVLPERSPYSIASWAAIALVATTVVGMGVAWLARPSRSLGIALRIGGLVLVAVGIELVLAYASTPRGQHGEGYLALVGAWLGLHGLVALLAPGVRHRAAMAVR